MSVCEAQWLHRWSSARDSYSGILLGLHGPGFHPERINSFHLFEEGEEELVPQEQANF